MENTSQIKRLVDTLTQSEAEPDLPFEPTRPEIAKLIPTRQLTHGSFTDNARISQNLKSMLHGEPRWDSLEPWQREALDLICTKISRAISGDPSFADHWLDIGGYSKLAHDPT